MGEIGIRRDEFLYTLKLWEILSIIRGYRKRELQGWREVRWQTFYVLCGMGASLKSPTDLLELPGDTETAEEISEDEIAELQKAIREENKKRAAQ